MSDRQNDRDDDFDRSEDGGGDSSKKKTGSKSHGSHDDEDDSKQQKKQKKKLEEEREKLVANREVGINDLFKRKTFIAKCNFVLFIYAITPLLVTWWMQDQPVFRDYVVSHGEVMIAVSSTLGYLYISCVMIPDLHNDYYWNYLIFQLLYWSYCYSFAYMTLHLRRKKNLHNDLHKSMVMEMGLGYYPLIFFTMVIYSQCTRRYNWKKVVCYLQLPITIYTLVIRFKELDRLSAMPVVKKHLGYTLHFSAFFYTFYISYHSLYMATGQRFDSVTYEDYVWVAFNLMLDTYYFIYLGTKRCIIPIVDKFYYDD